MAVGIVAILAAILLPVFHKAKEQAKSSVCISNFKQAFLSSSIYSSDYDDRFVLSRYMAEDEGTSAKDRTWVQLVLPYGRSFEIFQCPADYTHNNQTRAIFDGDVVPGDTYARYYTASKHTNLGYNYLYLSPLIRGSRFVEPQSRLEMEIASPAHMLLFGDSVHEVDESGEPQGGGSYLIVPPCRYYREGRVVRDTFKLDGVPNSMIYTGDLGWKVSPGDDPPPVGMGGLWPWHLKKRLTAMFADGHARSITLNEAADGCTVLPNWSGLITDRDVYIWDLD